MTTGSGAVILDFYPATGMFTLQVPRRDVSAGHIWNPQKLMAAYGLDMSAAKSTYAEAWLYTPEPYAAVSFADYATPAAREGLAGLSSEIARSWETTSDIHVEIPSGLELAPYELAAVEYFRSHPYCLIGDEPGAGKTIEAIAIANDMQAERVLVVVPASIRLQWAAKIREWSTLGWNMTVHVVKNGKTGIHPTAHWTIVSYDLLRNSSIAKRLATMRWDLLILDEAHYVKTIDSKRTRALFGGGASREIDPIANRAAAIVALTGTPLPNRPREAYTLARGLCWDAIDFYSEERFLDRFNPSQRRELIDPLTGRIKYFNDERSGRHAELQNRLRANFMIRRLKADIFPQRILPVYDLVRAEETGLVKAALKAEKLLDIDPDTFLGTDGKIDGQVATVRRMMGIALAPQAAEYAEMLLDGGEDKVVIFAWHREVLDILQKKLDRHGCLRVDGSSSGVQKAAAIERFQKDPGIHFIIGNALSLGTGTDGLQHVCSRALLAEPDWVPGTNQQCFDRLDRSGQQRTVLGDILVAPDSFAEKVLGSALRKASVIYNTLDRKVVA